jgi:hypothetical protein
MFKFLNGIKTYHNVLTTHEINSIISQAGPLLERISPDHPGLQTYSNFHEHLKKVGKGYLIDKILKHVQLQGSIYKCWVNYTDSNMCHVSWHNHVDVPPGYTAVLYLMGEEKHGTMFKKYGRIIRTKGRIGSMVTYPQHLMHTVPDKIKSPRLSLAFDFVFD